MKTPQIENTTVTLPSNIAAAITESLAIVGNGETLKEFIVSMLADMLTDNSGVFEGLCGYDPAAEPQLAAIRRKHGLGGSVEVAA